MKYHVFAPNRYQELFLVGTADTHDEDEALKIVMDELDEDEKSRVFDKHLQVASEPELEFKVVADRDMETIFLGRNA